MFVVFFKQKTAYELRSSDWSPDVCSSDLIGEREGPCFGGVVGKAQRLDHLRQHRASAELLLRLVKARDADGLSLRGRASGQFRADDEDADRKRVVVGKEGVGTWRSVWGAVLSKYKQP